MVLLVIAAAMAIPAAHDCSGFSQRVSEPVSVVADALLPAKIAAIPQPLRPGYMPSFKVGPFDYSGYGIALRSTDPRFGAIRFDASEGLYHPCGYRVEGASPWDVRDGKIEASALHFIALGDHQVIAAGSRNPAAELGLEPVLQGYTAGPTWHIDRATDSYFIGLMYTHGRSDETAIVAFPAKSKQVPARLLASVPLHLDALSALPYPHGGALAIDLEGRQRDGSIDYLILDLGQEEEDAIAKSFMPSTP